MAGAPAGPALDPERPADRLDAARETDESRPVRRPDERKHRPDQLVHLGLLRLGHALSGDAAQPPGASPPRPRALRRRWAATWGFSASATRSPETLGSHLPPPRWRGPFSSTGAWRSLPR